ncbi:MAG: nucleotide sugar dehydrogenase, partial [Halobacillus sp.]
DHTFQTINKIVAAQDKETLDTIHSIYQRVITAEVYKAASIKVAEASKIIENTQRDINIAFMNEISIIFNKLGINTHEAIEAASTKWNFNPYYPGLVGGHCIGVDPYYLIHKSKSVGYTPNFIESAREINDYMPEYIVKTMLEQITIQKKNLKDFTITVLGVTFKQNLPDTRNSKALEIVEKLKNLDLHVQVCDPHVDHNHFEDELKDLHQLEKSDVLILAVPHKMFTSLPVGTFQSLLKDGKGIIMDIKGALTKDELGEDITLWNL